MKKLAAVLLTACLSLAAHADLVGYGKETIEGTEFTMLLFDHAGECQGNKLVAEVFSARAHMDTGCWMVAPTTGRILIGWESRGLQAYEPREFTMTDKTRRRLDRRH